MKAFLWPLQVTPIINEPIKSEERILSIADQDLKKEF